MIGVQLRGRLGNQMFQYAAARTLSERLGHSLILASNTLGRPFGVVAHWLGVDGRPPYAGKQQNGILHKAFGCGPTFLLARAFELACPALFHHTFSPRWLTTGEGYSYEAFDESFFKIKSSTWLIGWFQSERYFTGNSDRVREWFKPRQKDARRVADVIARWPVSPEDMVAVHIRRGDYAQIRDGVSDHNQGWLLPMTYYHNALDRIPRNTTLAIFSDDPEWAENAFASRRPWISRGNSALVDMLLMARCRYNVTANSSFSWWAAWLNTRPDKVVFAPKYHLGWNIGCWVPGGIDVPGWEYLKIITNPPRARLDMTDQSNVREIRSLANFTPPRT
jgi:hypothetical protein